jgi:hypothetical protein
MVCFVLQEPKTIPRKTCLKYLRDSCLSSNISITEESVRSWAHEESPTQKTGPLGDRALRLKYHTEHFYLLNVGLLTESYLI